MGKFGRYITGAAILAAAAFAKYPNDAIKLGYDAADALRPSSITQDEDVRQFLPGGCRKNYTSTKKASADVNGDGIKDYIILCEMPDYNYVYRKTDNSQNILVAAVSHGNKYKRVEISAPEMPSKNGYKQKMDLRIVNTSEGNQIVIGEHGSNPIDVFACYDTCTLTRTTRKGYLTEMARREDATALKSTFYGPGFTDEDFEDVIAETRPISFLPVFLGDPRGRWNSNVSTRFLGYYGGVVTPSDVTKFFDVNRDSHDVLRAARVLMRPEDVEQVARFYYSVVTDSNRNLDTADDRCSNKRWAQHLLRTIDHPYARGVTENIAWRKWDGNDLEKCSDKRWVEIR